MVELKVDRQLINHQSLVGLMIACSDWVWYSLYLLLAMLSYCELPMPVWLVAAIVPISDPCAPTNHSARSGSVTSSDCCFRGSFQCIASEPPDNGDRMNSQSAAGRLLIFTTIPGLVDWPISVSLLFNRLPQKNGALLSLHVVFDPSTG